MQNKKVFWPKWRNGTLDKNMNVCSGRLVAVKLPLPWKHCFVNVAQADHLKRYIASKRYFLCKNK